MSYPLPTFALVRMSLVLLAVSSLPGVATLYAEEPSPETAESNAPVKLSWTGDDVAGNRINVPDKDRSTLLLFVMANQKQSRKAMERLKELLAKEQGLQVIAVISGESVTDKAGELAAVAEWTWPIVADPEHNVSGKMSVYAWPTTLLLDADGRQVAHIGGMPSTFGKDVSAYLDFLGKRIDQEELDKRLAAHDVVVSSGHEVATRHLQVARRLLDRRQFDQAQRELNQALKARPNDPRLHLAMARVRLGQHEPQEALNLLDSIEPNALAAWKIGALRGQALVALEKWSEAQQALTEALKLNPQPAGVYYHLGRVHEHAGRWEDAAAAYRAAFEQTADGRKVTTKR